MTMECYRAGRTLLIDDGVHLYAVVESKDGGFKATHPASFYAGVGATVEEAVADAAAHYTLEAPECPF